MSQGPGWEGRVPPPYGAPQFQAPPLPTPPVPPPSPSYAVVPVGWAPGPIASGPTSTAARRPQRPAVVALACTLAVTASLQWICGLSLLWVTAVVGSSTFDQLGDNGAVFHILSRFEYRMVDGLAVPLYLFPLASLVTGFLLLVQRPWSRLAHTVVGALALAWAGWWLRADLLWWFTGAWYVVVACLVLWTPAATAWYRWREPVTPGGDSPVG